MTISEKTACPVCDRAMPATRAAKGLTCQDCYRAACERGYTADDAPLDDRTADGWGEGRAADHYWRPGR